MNSSNESTDPLARFRERRPDISLVEISDALGVSEPSLWRWAREGVPRDRWRLVELALQAAFTDEDR